MSYSDTMLDIQRWGTNPASATSKAMGPSKHVVHGNAPPCTDTYQYRSNSVTYEGLGARVERLLRAVFAYEYDDLHI